MFKNSKRRTIDLIAVLVIIAIVVIIRLTSQGTPVEKVQNVFDLNSIKIDDYDGSADYVEVNGNKPFFKESEIKNEYYITLTALDSLNRAQGGIMCADASHIQEGERPDISKIHPSGWKSNSIFERSHLLMWKLSGNSDESNFVTGTIHFNEDVMQDFERQVTAYLWDNESNHVMYRVTPLFYDREVLCRGVLMEAYSVEDKGKLSFCVFVYNAEPGIYIDYLSGDYVKAQDDAA